MANIPQKNLLWGALVGGAIASIAVFLLTPTSGKKLRRSVMNSVDWRSQKTSRPRRRPTSARRRTRTTAVVKNSHAQEE